MYTLQRIPRRWLLTAVTAASLLTTVGTSHAAPPAPMRAADKSDAIHDRYGVVLKSGTTSVERTERKAWDRGGSETRQHARHRPARPGPELRPRADIDRIPRQRPLDRTRGVPFKAVDSGAAVVVATAGSAIQTADTGTGHATHLGRFKLVAGEHVDLATGAITGGFYTLTAANGNTIRGTYSGQALPGLTGYVVSGPVTGGTGRFTGATGFLVWRGTLNPTALTFSDVVTGWTSSPGCRKAGMTFDASAHRLHQRRREPAVARPLRAGQE